MTTTEVYSPTTASKPKLSWFLVPSAHLDETRFWIKLCEVVSLKTPWWSKQNAPVWASFTSSEWERSEASGVHLASCGASQSPVLTGLATGS